MHNKLPLRTRIIFLLSSAEKKLKIINDMIDKEQRDLEHMSYMHRRAKEIVEQCRANAIKTGSDDEYTHKRSRDHDSHDSHSSNDNTHYSHYLD